MSSSSNTIKLTLSVEQAREYARAYPHSKYIKPALDKITLKEFPFVVNSREELKELPDGIVAVDTSENVNFAWTKHSGSKWAHPLCGDACPVSSVPLPVTVVYSQRQVAIPSTITFEIPVEEARRIGGCIISPLVEAWDKEHVSPVEELLRVVKPGQIVYYEYSPGGARPDAFFKVDNTTFQRLPNNGDKTYVEDRALKALADIWSNVAPSNIKVI